MEISAIMPRIPSLDMAEKAQEPEPDMKKVNEAEAAKAGLPGTDSPEGAEDGTMKDPRRFDTFEKSRENPESDMTGIYHDNKEVQGNDEKDVSESKCTVNTDKVDAEIERLKKEAQEIREKLQAEKDEEKRGQLEQRLQRVEAELHAKDNDSYRKQNASYTYG